MSVSIERIDTGLCYTFGVGFTAPCPNFIPAFGAPAAWTFVPSPNPYLTTKSYRVTALAVDNAGNTQDVLKALTAGL